MPKISVIVPVYNMEKYLKRCVDSILLQSFSDFEVILVDDGSKDASGDICDSYALSDSRIRVIHKENGGVSAARNAALDIASGEYITFCDADDYLEKECLETLYKNIEEKSVDVVSYNFNVVGDLSNILSEFHQYPQCVKFFSSDWDNIVYLMFDILSNKVGWEIWTRIFKKSIIIENNIRFCETCNNYAEDMVFVLEYTLRCRGICVLDYKGYNYFQRSNSMMHNSGEIIKLNELNECSKYFGKVFLKYFKNNNYCRGYFPVLHWLMLSTEYERLVTKDRVLELSSEIKKIADKSWYKKMTRKIFFKYGFLKKVYGIKKARKIMIISAFCLHKNRTLYELSNRLLLK